MSKILEVRRIFRKVKKQEWKEKWVKNPLYDVEIMKEVTKLGRYYSEDEFIEKEFPVDVIKKSSHIEYRIECEFCKGTNGWVGRKDAKFCSDSCRNMAREKNNP